MHPTFPPSTLRSALIAAVVASFASLAGPAGPAQAGTYSVSGAGEWTPDVPFPEVAVYRDQGDFIIARNSGGPGSAGAGSYGRWLFDAPPGTAIVDVAVLGGFKGSSRWQATLGAYGAGAGGGVDVINCPGGPRCASGGAANLLGGGIAVPRAAQLAARVRCNGGAFGCPRDAIYGQANFKPLNVTLDDQVPPAVTAAGAAFNGWRSGNTTVDFNTSDNIGIRDVHLIVDDTLRERRQQGCRDGVKFPCPIQASGAFTVDTRSLSDGPHGVVVNGVDAGNTGIGARGTLLMDNTPPPSPQDLRVDGAGEGWRRENAFAVTWVSPKQAHAPIDALAYRLCPPDTAASKTTGCSELKTTTDLKAVDAKDATKGTRATGITVPKPGAYQARFVLRDAAGNLDEKTAITQTLRFDPAPAALTFLGQDPADPARLRVQASDATSGIARAEIEIQREGEQAWRPLAVELSPDGFTAVIDDETLPKGRYALRARAVDQAGNEATTGQRADGTAAELALPVRLRSRLAVGAKGRQRCRGTGRRRICRRSLRSKLSPRFGRRTRLYGRLFVGREPVRKTVVEVWRQIKLPGAPFQKVDTVTTSRTGRFSVTTGKAPARTLRFRYPGSKRVRGDNSAVSVGVRGATTFRPRRGRVVNGEYVKFRGRVRGAPLPPAGKLVELQVYTRRKWRTFAQPRSDAQGRWEFRYRFEEIKRTTRLRFRARVRAETGYPYETGTSRVGRVTVRGGQR